MDSTSPELTQDNDITCRPCRPPRTGRPWDAKLARRLALVIATAISGTCTCAVAAPVTSIGGFDHFNGRRLYAFPSDTQLLGAAVAPEVVELVEYDGEWADGMAEGEGLLMGKLIRRASDTSLQSTDPAIRGQAEAAQARRLPAPGASATFGTQTVPSVPDEVVNLRWAGKFHNGIPAGPGVLTWSKREFAGEHSLVTTLDHWRPVGSSTAFIGDLKVASFNLQWKNDKISMADGALAVLLYGVNKQVAAVYAGAVNSGAISGTWVDLPYSYSNGGGITSAFKNHEVMNDGQGTTFDCVFPQLPNKRPVSNYLWSTIGAGAISTDAFLNQDASVPGNDGMASCQVHKGGYAYKLTIERKAGFFQRLASVDSCIPPNGSKGTVTFKDGIYGCSYEVYEESGLSKFTDNLANVLLFKPAHVIADPVLKAEDKAFKSVSSSMCDALGYKEGTNCSFDSHGAITVVSFPTEAVRTNTTLTAPEKKIAENSASAKAKDPDQATSSLGPLTTFLDNCVYACPDALVPFAQASSEDLFRAMQPGFDQDARNNRVAGIWGTLAIVVGLALPSYQAYQAWLPLADARRFDEAEAWLGTLDPNKYEKLGRAKYDLAARRTNWAADTVLESTLQSAKLLQSEVDNFAIGQALKKSEYLTLIYLVHGDYKQAEQILKANRDMKTSDEFWQAAMTEFYKKYELPPPPRAGD